VTNKNDVADAQAICESVNRPNMRFSWPILLKKLGLVA